MPVTLEREQHLRLDHVDAERLVEEVVLGEDGVHLLGDVVAAGGVERHRAAQRRDPAGERPSSHGQWSWWWRAAEPKSHSVGSPPRGSTQKRPSLSFPHVPIVVAVM